MTKLLKRRGVPVAVVGARRWYLAPPVTALEAHDPERRAIVALCHALTNDHRFTRAPAHQNDDPRHD